MLVQFSVGFDSNRTDGMLLSGADNYPSIGSTGMSFFLA